MNRIKAFGAFWYDFVIGDDWHVAAMVVAGLALTAACVRVAGVNAWWLLPVFAFAALAWSLHRATKPSKPLSGTTQGSSPPPTLSSTGRRPARPGLLPRAHPGQRPATPRLSRSHNHTAAAPSAPSASSVHIAHLATTGMSEYRQISARKCAKLYS